MRHLKTWGDVVGLLCLVVGLVGACDTLASGASLETALVWIVCAAIVAGSFQSS